MKLASRIFRRDDWYVTSKFGPRNAIYNSKGELVSSAGMHNGCDYGTRGQKWPQYAIEDGTVLSAGKDSLGGIFAWVRFPRIGIELLYYHLNSVTVSKGQLVNKDTVIGYTGMTGNATGIHLHLGMRKTGSTKYYDPDTYDYQEYVAPVNPVKSIDEIAKEVINGKWNNYPKRKELLEAAGYNYSEVQGRVNEILKENQTSIKDKYYIVVSGDNLSKIAKKFGTTWNKIYQNNKTLIDNDAKRHGINSNFYNHIYVGQKLIIK